MNIKLVHKDDTFYGVEEFIKPIIESTKKNIKFVEILCEILQLSKIVTNSLYNDIEKLLKLYKNYYFTDASESLLNEYTIFSERILAFYWEILEEAETSDVIFRFNQDLYKKHKLSDKSCRLSRYRGIMFECIITEFVRNRYSDGIFDTGCRVFINHQLVVISYGEGAAEHKETFDVVGWHNDALYGEFYECKVSPNGFKEENYRLYIRINEMLSQNTGVTSLLAFVSADSQRNFENQIKLLEESSGLKLLNLLLIGREKIFEILEYQIPISA